MLANIYDVCRQGRKPVKVDDLRYGAELEVVGVDRLTLANAIIDNAKTYGLTWRLQASQTDYRVYDNRQYDVTTYQIIDNRNRAWLLTNDGSLTRIGGKVGTEVVTPPLLKTDFDNLCLSIVVSQIQKLAQVDDSCSVHIHVDTSLHTPLSVARLYSYFAFYAPFIYTIIGANVGRIKNYCKPLPKDKLARLHTLYKKRKTDFSKQDLCKVNFDKVFSDDFDRLDRYDANRYYIINLNNLWRKSRTLECRMFNGANDLRKIIAFIDLVLALNAKAINAKAIKKGCCNITDLKTRLSVFFADGLGLTGDNYANTRHVLTASLNSQINKGYFDQIKSYLQVAL